MNKFEEIKKMFEDLGFGYDEFWADAGHRDIFTNADGERIIFYEEENNDGEYNYLVTDRLISSKLHKAISAYIEYKGWLDE